MFCYLPSFPFSLFLYILFSFTSSVSSFFSQSCISSTSSIPSSSMSSSSIPSIPRPFCQTLPPSRAAAPFQPSTLSAQESTLPRRNLTRTKPSTLCGIARSRRVIVLEPLRNRHEPVGRHAFSYGLVRRTQHTIAPRRDCLLRMIRLTQNMIFYTDRYRIILPLEAHVLQRQSFFQTLLLET